MSRIRSVARRIRSAASRVRDDEPLRADEAAALHDVLAVLPDELREEDEIRLLREASGVPRRRFVRVLSASAAAVLLGLSVWYAIASFDWSDGRQVAVGGPALKITVTPSPAQAVAPQPTIEKAAPVQAGHAVNETVVDLGAARSGEIIVTADQDCVLFASLLRIDSGAIALHTVGQGAERIARRGSKESFVFNVPEETESGTLLILASRERRDLAAMARSVTESFSPPERDEEKTVARIIQQLGEYPDLTIMAARFRRSRR